MVKKIILVLIISSITVFGFAQKSKKKTRQEAPQNEYFVMTINGDTTPATIYCPNVPILFSYIVKDSSIFEREVHWKWYNDYYSGLLQAFDDVDSIKLPFSLIGDIVDHVVTLEFEISTDNVNVKDTITLSMAFKVDYYRTYVDTSVCQGREIILPSFKEPITYTSIPTENAGIVLHPAAWDTLPGSNCDSLVCWRLTVEPYKTLEYSIKSCDTVWWWDMVVARTSDWDLTEPYRETLDSVFLADDPESSCDTLKILNVTIVAMEETKEDGWQPKLNLKFDQKEFCDGNDMEGTITLDTDFNAFDWTVNKSKYELKERDSTFTILRDSLLKDIEHSGYYSVLAYMDTSLYDTLINLRITNCSRMRDTIIEDCDLIIPNVITPNEDGANDVLGIKKLNIERDNEISIYDRWGKRVFHQKMYKCVFKSDQFQNIEDAFSGLTQHGQKLPEGTYYYAFSYDALINPERDEEADQVKTFYSGTIVILR